MGKLAFVFPGQGSQHVGMGKSFYEAFPVAREVFDEANDALGFDIKKLSFEGPEEELNKTENTQPALLTSSIAALKVLKEKADAAPSCMAGHSLGEYTALVAAGSIKFRDAVRLVRLRGKFMQESVPQG
ncbi:MAG: ACP S-malonyltransferase, partial [Deltaproteobacteria bacterium]|nr:ACP S-malonyltransferase [Deltaproteobacteria bacterium]